jgi:phosphodiesterase/alkaline phosphatase D-like protein
MIGRFRTAPGDRRLYFVCGVGRHGRPRLGIDESRGGMRTYAPMLRNRPDSFIHSGDTIYADGPIVAEQKMPNGEVWKNVVTEEKAKPAETLADSSAILSTPTPPRSHRPQRAPAHSEPATACDAHAPTKPSKE